ncbi:hypothetical protein [Pigmentiphaga daeguensis]|jgi:hypothetical protein|uniref:hypothetical protein n=1 Tax=Pigmentiphaga daeguensis TaxID=414049 RepID=UPI0031DBDE3C
MSHSTPALAVMRRPPTEGEQAIALCSRSVARMLRPVWYSTAISHAIQYGG